MNLDALISNDYNDNALNKKNHKEKFYNLLAKNGFDFSDIDDATRLPKSLLPVISNDTDLFNKFNICLAEFNKNKEVSILDAMSYIVNDYLEAPIALKCLDEMNFIALKNELQQRFQMKSEEEEQDFSLLDYLG